MNMQDPISDMITRIKNGNTAKKNAISIPYSKLKLKIIKILKEEGYINHYSIKNDTNKIIIYLKYFNKKPVIEHISRISKPGLRIYEKKNNLTRIGTKLGISILSTSLGVMTSKSAYKLGVGGEIICQIY